jgi:hypothetical protein
MRWICDDDLGEGSTQYFVQDTTVLGDGERLAEDARRYVPGSELFGIS